MPAVNCPDVAGFAVHTETTDGHRHVTTGLGLLWNFDALNVAKDAVCEVHHEACFSLLDSVQRESTGESCASLLGVSCLQCTHIMRCNPKGQLDWNYFNSILLWTWCSAMLTVIGAAWIFICAASISGGRRCSVLRLQNCSLCLEVVPELYTFIYCIVFIITTYTYMNTNRRLSKPKAYLTIQLLTSGKVPYLPLSRVVRAVRNKIRH